MLTNLGFIALIGAGSVYAAAKHQKRFEETIPVCAMAVVLVLFLFGLLGVLAHGMVVLAVLSALLYLLTAATVVKENNLRQTLRNLLTPGAVFFMLVVALVSVCNVEMVASSWDEFSHWMDIVKAAAYVDDFGTNPAAHSTYQSYPPAMMLFQYALQKVYMLVKPQGGFSEWRTYFAYQIFFVAILMPFLRNIEFRQILKLALYAVIILVAPLLFYSNLFSAIYIDPFIGILFGAGMAMILLCPRKDGWYVAYICMLCAVMTLSKDVGFAFSLFLALAFGADCLLDAGARGRIRFFVAPAALLAAYLPKLLWSWELKTSGAKLTFTGKINWKILLDVILGRDTSYRQSLVRTYWDALNSKTIVLGNIPVPVNYIGLLLLFLVLLYILWRIHTIRNPEKRGSSAAVLGLSALMLIGYLVGLCVIYMFKFSQYEAVRLASMERYLNIAFLGIWMLILLLLADYVCSIQYSRAGMCILLAVLLLVSPLMPFRKFIRGDNISYSRNIRAPYEPLKNSIQQICDGDDRIYFVSQETTGFDFWVSRFNARPNSFNPGMTWSIGQPFYDGDVWTLEMTPEQWKAMLMEQYDYVALYKINDYFREHFGMLFEQSEDITENALYRVNHQTGLLEKCE